MSTNWSPPSDPNFVGIKYTEPTGSMGLVHLATFIYHENEPNVGKNTSPMDDMWILFISSSVTLGIWNSSEKPWMIREKNCSWFHCEASQRSWFSSCSSWEILNGHPEDLLNTKGSSKLDKLYLGRSSVWPKNPWESKKPGAPGEDWP